jgi:uncharacterized CHY-type Zn-finger protein
MPKCTTCETEKSDEQFRYGKVTRSKCRTCHNEWRKEATKKYKEKAETLKKTCTICEKELSGSAFPYTSNVCKACKSERDKEEKHRPTEDAPPKTCTKCVKEQPAPQFRYQSNVCRTCEQNRLYEWRTENPDKFKEICKTYRTKDENKVKRNDYLRNKYNTDMNYRLEHQYRGRVRSFIKEGTGKAKYEALLGCSWDTFRVWIESNFVGEMTWENYGTLWHIDHTMPCSVFDFTIEENRKVCFNWSNLFPMLGEENISKSNKIDMALVTKNKNIARDFMKSHNNLIMTDSLPADLASESGVLDTKVSLKDGTGE